MIGELRNWIISICTAVIFITAVEMIMPNNSFKKYAKFVLGLILGGVQEVTESPLLGMLMHSGMNIQPAFLMEQAGMTLQCPSP